jgi:hypothetical protein
MKSGRSQYSDWAAGWSNEEIWLDSRKAEWDFSLHHSVVQTTSGSLTAPFSKGSGGRFSGSKAARTWGLSHSSISCRCYECVLLHLDSAICLHGMHWDNDCTFQQSKYGAILYASTFTLVARGCDWCRNIWNFKIGNLKILQFNLKTVSCKMWGCL